MNWKFLKFAVILVLLFVGGYYGYMRYADRSEIASVPKFEFETDPLLTAGHVPLLCSPFAEVYKEGEYDTRYCPPNHAFYTGEDRTRDHFKNQPSSFPFGGRCCPLPADDILTDEHIYNIGGECPSNYIVTGATGDDCGEQCYMRCTRVNTERYRLGEKYQALYYKRDGTYPKAGRGGAKQVLLSDVPLALRYSFLYEFSEVDTLGFEAWDPDGCVGAPFGAVLVEKRGRGCGNLYFRPIFFKKGAAVRTYPECDSVVGWSERKVRCLSTAAKPQ